MEERSKFSSREMQNYLREIVFIIFERKKLILRIFCLVFSVAVLFAVFLPSYYRSSAKFSVSMPQTMDPLQRESYYDYKNRIMRLLQDQKEMIYSSRVLEKVITSQFPETGVQELAALQDRLRTQIEVTPPGGETFEGSSVFYLSYQGTDPKKVADVTRAIADAYQESYREVTREKTDYSFDFFKFQVDGLYEQLNKKEAGLRQYEVQNADLLIEMLNLEHGKTNLEIGPNAMLTDALKRQGDLNEQCAAIQKNIVALEKQIASPSIPVVLPEMEVHGRAITVFKNKVAQLQIQLNEMKSQFKDDFAALKQVAHELELNIQSLKEELQRAVNAQKILLDSLESKRRELDMIVNALRERIRTIAEEKSVYEHLKREYALVKDAYSSARSQMEQARLANSLNQEKQYVTMVDAPVPALSPFKPKRGLLVLIGLFGGLMLSVATALTMDHFDHTIKKPLDIERYLDVPLIGSISRMG